MALIKKRIIVDVTYSFPVGGATMVVGDELTLVLDYRSLFYSHYRWWVTVVQVTLGAGNKGVTATGVMHLIRLLVAGGISSPENES